jgi:rubredoxin
MSITVVARYREPYAAHLARALLDSAGIPAQVTDEHMIGNDWLLSNSIGGVKVVVPAAAAEDARALLAEVAAPGAAEPSTRAEAPPTHGCPSCGCAGQSLDGIDRRVRALSMLIGFPFALGRHRMRCSGCGVVWRPRDPT